MVVMVYWMVGLQVSAWKFFYFLLMFFLSVTMYTFLGQMLVIVCPNQLLAQLLAAFLNQMWTIFNGFLVPYPQTPAGWQWMSRISPTTWILYGFGATQLADSNVPLDAPGPGNITVGDYVSRYAGVCCAPDLLCSLAPSLTHSCLALSLAASGGTTQGLPGTAY
jgi:hypothetical protein